ncbi:hypothetical protein [Nocardioides sp. TF02-7]|uniref:hypothetical protein n=1 Tax=Nocardioides sp. TF02-7 TaxID=2917724 RepID=UPI001F06164C|nr:hypothetical protein [Nocardioides sp. TF02-7]UMG92824.1 hypothetical protein MF408_00035 [Nocardioides sp. TF02-7]
MTNFLIGLLAVQLLGGLHQLTFVLGAGQKLSSARATRLPDAAVVGHVMLGGLAFALWLGWVMFDERAFAWMTLATVVLAAAVGGFMFHRTFFRSPVVDRPAADPADVRVAEKQIPAASLAVHGLGAAALILGTLLVALDVLD